MDKFTSEEIKALREYLEKLNALHNETPPERLTPEEWDEAMNAIQETGKIPAKYAGRIGESEITVQSEIVDGKHVYRPEGVTKRAYYDIAQEAYNRRFIELGEEYQKPVEKAILSSLTEEKQEHNPQGERLEDIIKRILENPEILRELEKEARRLEKRELPALGALPNGEALNFLYRVLSGKSGRIPANGQTKHDLITPDFKANGDLTITRKTDKGQTTIEIKKAGLLFGKSNKGFTKVLTFVMQEMAFQNFPLRLGFPLKAMIDLGIYKNTSNAARGLRDFFGRQKDISIGGKFKKGREIVASTQGLLFFHLDITKSGFATLGANPEMNWDFFASYFTIFPSWAYKLNVNAFLLVRFIFFIARQRTEEIKRNEKFKISLDAVRENLGLPAPEEVKNRRYREAIVEPIEAAIEEIETEANLHPETKDYAFTMTLARTETSKINEWLQGYLEIGLKRDFAETFVRIATEREEKQAQWEKAKQAELAKLEAKAEYAAKKE